MTSCAKGIWGGSGGDAGETRSSRAGRSRAQQGRSRAQQAQARRSAAGQARGARGSCRSSLPLPEKGRTGLFTAEGTVSTPPSRTVFPRNHGQ
jgi:hypothetical protein